MKIRIILIAAAVAFGIYGFTGINEDAVSSESQNIQGKGFKVGQTAPEIELTSINGTKMKLSDFRGKMVLVDFWASWCRPCRMANPHVVQAYNEYKDKSFPNADKFVVFGISLDRKADAWKKAIKDDKLNWETNFLGNQAIAKQYGVASIPTQFLIDGNGVIVASYVGYDPDDSFDKKLKALVKK